MESSAIVSIIVPVYNAEMYLSKCIDSILNQTYEHIEVIIINDGSTDESGFICNDYAQVDRRVKVIHQENAGPSIARNKGMLAATGKYIQFLDADDNIEANMTEKLVTAMTKDVQLVISGYKSVHRSKNNPTTANYIPSITGVYPKAAFMKHIGNLYKNIILPSLCNKLYISEIIKAFDVHFIENLNMGEDLLFNLAYIKVCSHINVLPDQLYNYVTDNEQSLSRGFHSGLFENQQMLHRKVRAYLIEHHSYAGENKNCLKVIYTNSIVNSFNNLFHQHSTLTSKQKKEQIATIISDGYLRENVVYFKDNPQTRFIGQLIKFRSVHGIYWFFRMKKILQDNMHPLYKLLKNVN